MAKVEGILEGSVVNVTNVEMNVNNNYKALQATDETVIEVLRQLLYVLCCTGMNMQQGPPMPQRKKLSHIAGGIKINVI